MIADLFGYTSGGAARGACVTNGPAGLREALTQVGNVHGRPRPRACTCGRCLTCASREREAARRDGDLDRARAWGRYARHCVRAGQDASDLTPAVELAMRKAAAVCPLCLRPMTERRWRRHSKNIDHVVPIRDGGAHSAANARIICAACNQRRRHVRDG